MGEGKKRANENCIYLCAIYHFGTAILHKKRIVNEIEI